MSKMYALPPDITRADLLKVLEQLKNDAGDQFAPLAKFHTRHDCAEHRAKAMFYAGQVELLTSMLWALDGEAESEGCKPTIEITPRQDL